MTINLTEIRCETRGINSNGRFYFIYQSEAPFSLKIGLDNRSPRFISVNNTVIISLINPLCLIDVEKIEIKRLLLDVLV